MFEQVSIRIWNIAGLSTQCDIEAQQEAVLCICAEVNFRRDEPVLSRAGRRRGSIIGGQVCIDLLVRSNINTPIERSRFGCFAQGLLAVEYFFCGSRITTPPVLWQIGLHCIEVLTEADDIIGNECTCSAPFRLVTGYGIAEVFETEEVSRSGLEVVENNHIGAIQLLVEDERFVFKLFACSHLELYIRVDYQFRPANGSGSSRYILCALSGSRRTEVTLDNLEIIYEEVTGRRTCRREIFRVRSNNRNTSLTLVFSQRERIFLPVVVFKRVIVSKYTGRGCPLMIVRDGIHRGKCAEVSNVRNRTDYQCTCIFSVSGIQLALVSSSCSTATIEACSTSPEVERHRIEFEIEFRQYSICVVITCCSVEL